VQIINKVSNACNVISDQAISFGKNLTTTPSYNFFNLMFKKDLCVSRHRDYVVQLVYKKYHIIRGESSSEK